MFEQQSVHTMNISCSWCERQAGFFIIWLEKNQINDQFLKNINKFNNKRTMASLTLN